MIPVHLPVLQIVVPLLSAPLVALIGSRRLSYWIALVVSISAFAMSADLMLEVLNSGPISYALGGWAAPWGIEYRIDVLNGFVLLVVSGMGALTMMFARRSVEAEIPDRHQALFYACYLLCLTGLLGVTITGDLFNVFVFLEISSLSSYVLISLGKDRRALTAAYNYLILGTIGATFIVISIGLLYMVTGTLNMADMAKLLPDLRGNSVVLVGFAFFIVGVSLKLALFPLHIWLPNAYTYAPSVVTIFLAATATKVSIYVLLRFIFSVFGTDFSFNVIPLGEILMGLAIAGMFIASTAAIFQDNAKRMLAYSSVAQVGYIILGISLATPEGVGAGILHLFNHAIIKGGLFMALGCIFFRTGSVMISDMRGLGHSMPWTMAAFVAGGLSIIGVPLTSGFISKWYLISAAFDLGLWWVGLLVLLSSLLAVIYIWRIVETAYFNVSDEGTVEKRVDREAPLSMLLTLWALVALNVWFGIDTSLTADIANAAGAYLTGGGS